ncbi:MAG: hypothetical protein Kow0060_13250 [Methylohalobius crimeensis]
MAAERLKIAVLGSAGKFPDIIRAFIRKYYRAGILVEPSLADVCIVDLDAYEGKSLLQDLRRQYPDRQVIALSLRDLDAEKVIRVKKPLQANDLIQSLEKVRTERNSTKLVVKEETDEQLSQAATGVGEKHRADPAYIRYGWAGESDGTHYKPADYLQGLLTRAYRQSSLTGIAVRVETGWEPIFIFPKARKVWINVDDKKLHAFCRVPLKVFAALHGDKTMASSIGIHPEPVVDLRDFPEPLQPMNAFLWKVAWWNSGGRLPEAFQPSSPVRLKHWPNLTRCAGPPDSVRISALLVQQSVSPLRAAKLLGVAPNTVFGLVSAAAALNLIERLREPDPVQKESAAPVRHAGLLQRILQRLGKG